MEPVARQSSHPAADGLTSGSIVSRCVQVAMAWLPGRVGGVVPILHPARVRRTCRDSP